MTWDPRLWQMSIAAPQTTEEWAFLIWSSCHTVNGISEGEARRIARTIRAEAFEEAARVAESGRYGSDATEWQAELAQDIRALAAREGKKL